MVPITPHAMILRISGALLALALLLSACNMPTNVPNPVPSATPAGPAATVVSPTTAPAAASTPVILTATLAATAQPDPNQAAYPAGSMPTQAEPVQAAYPAEQPAESAAQAPASVNVDASGVAQKVTSEVVPTVASGDGLPWFQVLPEHIVLTLQGYPVANHVKQPQIFVYPVSGLNTNQNAAEEVQRVQQLLQNQPTGEAISLPYLPLEPSAKQMVHHVRAYLDFKNGKGMRYLTQWGNGLVPVNNQELIYTFQGLTSDGKYYVAAVLPVTLQGLPASADDKSRLPSDFPNNYTGYLADTASLLEQNPASAYTPDLSKLDAMMQSIEVK